MIVYSKIYLLKYSPFSRFTHLLYLSVILHGSHRGSLDMFYIGNKLVVVSVDLKFVPFSTSEGIFKEYFLRPHFQYLEKLKIRN